MALNNRLTNLNVSVFTLGGAQYIDDLEDASISFEIENDEARAIKDQWSYVYATGRSFTVESSVFVSPSAALVALAASGSAQVTFSYVTGGATYAGTGLITSANHSTGRGLQKQKITIKGQGAPTVS